MPWLSCFTPFRSCVAGVVGPDGSGLDKLGGGSGGEAEGGAGRKRGRGELREADAEEAAGERGEGAAGRAKAGRAGGVAGPGDAARGSGGQGGGQGRGERATAAQVDALRHALTLGFANK